MNNCKHLKIVPMEVDYNGLAAFRDECADCGAIMVPDHDNAVDGVIPMKALPMAKVISLDEYRKTRMAKTQGVANG